MVTFTRAPGRADGIYDEGAVCTGKNGGYGRVCITPSRRQCHSLHARIARVETSTRGLRALGGSQAQEGRTRRAVSGSRRHQILLVNTMYERGDGVA
jgi:hypothetical protein